MKNHHDITGGAKPVARATPAFWLDSTLDFYEVEELDGHELAKLLSEFPMEMNNEQDLDAGKKTSD